MMKKGYNETRFLFFRAAKKNQNKSEKMMYQKTRRVKKGKKRREMNITFSFSNNFFPIFNGKFLLFFKCVQNDLFQKYAQMFFDKKT